MGAALLNGMEGIFIPVKDSTLSAKWYEEKLGFKLVYREEEAAVMQIGEDTKTVVCLVKTPNHQPMKFPDNNFGVGKYYNFLTDNIDETYRMLTERDVKLNHISCEGEAKFFTFYDPDGNPLGVCQ
jgi:glyoxylase I family protein